MRITNSIDIAAPPAEVFYWLDDPEQAKQWMTSVAESRILNETPERVGTTFVETVTDGDRSTTMRGTVVGYEQDRRFAVHLTGERHEVDVEFVLDEIACGTRLTQVADLRFRGPMLLMGFVLGPFLRKSIRRQAEQEFAMLARLCEGVRRDEG
jgi:carbon monoxide dehydrogenase subunit G